MPAGRTLKPMTIAFDATARLTSPSVMAPTPAWMMVTFTFSVDSLASASATASTEPCTSALMMSRARADRPRPCAWRDPRARPWRSRGRGSSTFVLRLSAISCGLLRVLDDVQRIAGARHLGEAEDLDRRGRAGLGDVAAVLVGHRADLAPGGAGEDDVADAQRAVLNRTRATGPLAAIEERLDDGAAGAACFGFALSSSTSAWSAIISRSCSMPSPVLARDVRRRSCRRPTLRAARPSSTSSRLTRSGSAPGLSILLTATMIGTFAALAWCDGFLGLRHDAVVGRDDEDDDVGHRGAAGAHLR